MDTKGIGLIAVAALAAWYLLKGKPATAATTTPSGATTLAAASQAATAAAAAAQTRAQWIYEQFQKGNFDPVLVDEWNQINVVFK